MPIYTTYLSNKPKAKAEKLGSCFVYFVMRNRGNNAIGCYTKRAEKVEINAETTRGK